MPPPPKLLPIPGPWVCQSITPTPDRAQARVVLASGLGRLDFYVPTGAVPQGLRAGGVCAFFGVYPEYEQPAKP